MPAQGSRPNVLILLLDSVPARRLSCYGYHRPTTPNLDGIAREGVRFAELVATGSQSPPAHASLFTGLYPDRHSLMFSVRFRPGTLPGEIPTLAQVLSLNGYRTWCISNKLDVGSITGLDRGFQQVVEMNRRWMWPFSGIHFKLKRRTMNLNGLFDDGASGSNRRLRRWIDQDSSDDRPFCAFINYADAHYPYGAPRPFRFRFTSRRLSFSRAMHLFRISLRAEEVGEGAVELSERDFSDLSDLFDGGVAYLDHKVGELVACLESRGLLDKTLIVILADHGEFLGDHGWIGHGQSLYESVLRVPLIMRWPRRLPTGVVDTRPIQTVDVFPTILDLLGVTWDGLGRIDGRSLLPVGAADPPREDLFAFFPGETAIRTRGMKLIVGDERPPALYDLRTDPGEARDLGPDRPEEVRRLRGRLEGFLARTRQPTVRARGDAIDKPRYALGINYYDHDSAVALVRDGEIVFAVAEERLSRQKKDASFPHRSVAAALEFAKIDYAAIDQICFGWQRPGASQFHDLKCFLSGSLPIFSRYSVGSARRLLRELNQYGGERLLERRFGPHSRPIHFVDHHYAHALSAYLLSGFDEASVLVVDGRGAWEATTLWRAGGGDCALIDSIAHPDSLGFFYAAFTDFLGFRRNSDEWKVMGLAPYGKPGVDLGRYIALDGDGSRVSPRPIIGRYYGDVEAIERDFGRRRIPESEITDREKDIAWAVQDACEEAMESLSRSLVRRTGLRKLCLAGGVAMNSKANGRILASGLVDDVFIQPAATDDGTAVGAAIAAARLAGGPVPRYRLEDVYLGPEYGDGEIESFLRTCKIPFTRPPDIAREAAEMLASGKIVGWFQGRMEFGPRALGNRSILADPRDPAMKDRVNAVVKFREGWRPFAPTVLLEKAEEYFVGCKESPFMILTFPVREPMKGVIPAVTHVDGSARVQTIKREVNPRYHALIEHFERLTGVAVVMNTSFNLREEPIVCSPKDAVRTFYSSGLDALCIGPFLIRK